MTAADSPLDSQIARWRDAGLTEEEASLIAARRRASLDTPTRVAVRNEALVALGLAVAAAVAVKLPGLFGLALDDDVNEPYYFRNISLFVLPLLTLYFAWKRRLRLAALLMLALAFAAAAVVANVYRFPDRSNTEMLLALHLPIALWLVVGVAYAGGRWFVGAARMNFVRFSGELAIYYVLIALGGGVFTGFTLALFEAIGQDAEWLAGNWLVPCGAMGAVLVASWLAETRQGVIGNIAPVLTRIFTPLFTLLLLVFLGTMAWTGSPIDVEREVLIAFDLLLVLVVGLVLYAASARDPHAPPGFFDALQLLLVVCALAVDGVALAAMAARISEFGFTPNRVAALGENVILLANLAGSAWLYARFLSRRGAFSGLERWQLAYLPVYAAWAALVALVFPPLFGYR
jgi:hypothetical protein